MASLSGRLTGIMEEAFGALDLPAENARVSVSAAREDAEFQCNGAMSCAKIARKNPRDIAQDVIDVLRNKHRSGVFKDLSVGGPGFINIVLKESFIAQHLMQMGAQERFGVEQIGAGQSVLLDYGGPNIAKAMHVGHLRSSIIGDALRRMCLYAGYKAIGDVHLGDWGTPMGMILSELDLMGYDGEITMDMLADIYPKASAACKENEERMALAREATRRLQDGDEYYTAKWRRFIDVSIEGMKENFDTLCVHFDEWKGESDAHSYIAPMVEDIKSRNIAIEDQGAWIIPVARDDDKKDIPPLILLKSDGAVLYSTTDLATIVERIESHNPDKIIYIVDQRQHLHFEQVFRAVRIAAIVVDNRPELVFAGFGTMNGTDGKPFKTRAGGVMRLEDLISMAREKAYARLDEAALAQDMGEEERSDVAHKVAIAALKFADLQNNRISDYIFDIDRMTSFEGKTGPYLLYQAVRIQSLLRKAGVGELQDCVYPVDDDTRLLALLLAEYPDHFYGALRNYTPHILCDYAYRLAQEFSSFYGNCHILSERDKARRAGLLMLCRQTHSQLCDILSLLGIEVPERM
ncbi:MAG: arginine--tRNA ligase [Alphaproteobacteria bacterium]